MSILLVPIGRIDIVVIERLRDDLSKIFNKEVLIGKAMSEPEYAYNRKRNQYHSTAIIDFISHLNEYKKYEKLLGVADHDLYVPGLNFVFGEASQKVAVISLSRLRQAYYDMPEDKNLFYKRALTEAVHELGHTYGLGHCRDPECVMYFSNTIMDTDRKGTMFCNECRNKLDLP